MGASQKAKIPIFRTGSTIEGSKEKAFSIEVEPCRLWPPLRIDFAGGFGKTNETIFRKVPELEYVESVLGKITIIIPLEIFNGFHHSGSPMRINVWNDNYAWIKRQPWPNRLLHGDFNPDNMGWLVFDK